MDERPVGLSWYCVRTVFQLGREPTSTYEERLTLWSATGFSDAIAMAEAEAHDYVDSLEDSTYTGLAQAYRIFGAPGHGVEVFSLMRDSSLAADAYISAFFDTGEERQFKASER